MGAHEFGGRPWGPPAGEDAGEHGRRREGRGHGGRGEQGRGGRGRGFPGFGPGGRDGFGPGGPGDFGPGDAGGPDGPRGPMGFGPGGPGGFGPGGFGPGGPAGFGRGRGGPGGRGGFGAGFRRGRPGRGRRGDVRAAALALLQEGPRNGYQIIADITERSHELWKPSPGSVYPALSSLEDEGLIEPVEVEGKKLFQLSEAGTTYVTEHAEEVKAPWDAVAEPWRGMLDSRRPMMQIGMALQQLTMLGDAKAMGSAQKILDETVASLYRLLADSAAGPQDDAPDDAAGDTPAATPES